MDYDSAISYLLNREKFGMKLGLRNINDLLAKLGNPEKSFRTIHVTGTNGKGSVCALIAEVLQRQGYKVGLYTSPHLVDFRERIRVDGKLISKEDISRLTERLVPLVDKHTYFEVITALAFQHFKEQEIDFGVIEVGLGGRLDATNVIIPEVSVITKIALEHTEHLGDTIEKIAFEKAGIIKRNVPLVTGADNAALGVFRRTCRKSNSRMYVVNRDYNKLPVGLKGNYQRLNSSIALKTIEVLRTRGIAISDMALESGFLEAKWPGRMQFMKKDFLIDCAHNPDGVEALCEELKLLKEQFTKVILVTGIMKDKDIGKMCGFFNEAVDEAIITRPKIERASIPEGIAKHLKIPYRINEDVLSALDYAFKRHEENPGSLVVLAGSIFTVGEALQRKGIVPFE